MPALRFGSAVSPLILISDPPAAPTHHHRRRRRNNARVNITRVQCSVTETAAVRMNGRERTVTRVCGPPVDLCCAYVPRSSLCSAAAAKEIEKEREQEGGAPLRVAARSGCDEAEVRVRVPLEGRTHPDWRLRSASVEHHLLLSFHTDVRPPKKPSDPPPTQSLAFLPTRHGMLLAPLALLPCPAHPARSALPSHSLIDLNNISMALATRRAGLGGGR